jgi:hypothetical protein
MSFGIVVELLYFLKVNKLEKILLNMIQLEIVLTWSQIIIKTNSTNVRLKEESEMSHKF